MKNNTLHYDFKKHLKSANRQKRMIRIMAIFGAFLTISGIIGSIICYILGR